VIRRRRFKLFTALLFVAVMPAAIKLYTVQEDFFVVLSIALVFAAILFVLVVSVLLQEGLQRALRSVKNSSALLGARSHLHLWITRKP
jgi:hypothetical protein